MKMHQAKKAAKGEEEDLPKNGRVSHRVNLVIDVKREEREERKEVVDLVKYNHISKHKIVHLYL